jgi:hypothetical protein
MSIISNVLAELRPYPRTVVILVVGVLAGAAMTWAADDPRVATPYPVTGIVTWSNADSRQIMVDLDGAGDGVVHMAVADDLPPCLAARGTDVVRMERRRVELEVIKQEIEGAAPGRVVTAVRCFD